MAAQPIPLHVPRCMAAKLERTSKACEAMSIESAIELRDQLNKALLRFNSIP